MEANGDIYHNLQLIANAADIPVCRSAAEVAKAYGVRRRDVVFFSPGYHVLSDSLRVGSGQTVYLSGGAYVKGWMSVWQASGSDENTLDRPDVVKPTTGTATAEGSSVRTALPACSLNIITIRRAD